MNETNSFTQTAQQVKGWLSPESIQGYVHDYGLPVLFAIIILIVGAWAAKISKDVIHRLLSRRKLDPIIVGFIANFTYILFMVFVVLAALEKVGVKTTSFVAILGAAGLAIGLALQGSLANFAAGFLMIVFRPFKKGDYVEAGGTAGIVDEIQVFTTILNTPDNRRVIVPNAKIMSDNITNYSAMDTRRLDLTFGVSYGDDIQKVKAVLQRIVAEDPRVLKDPAAQILVGELAASSVNFIMRVWLKSGDYWPFKFDTTEKVKVEFDKEGITIPFPQHDVHLFQEK
ncbi:MAG TPA: mechanosensitive ion channel domain-containing protein [Verrucomicrobiae bacterium]|nr:mechanosensitive ion channel domain-containing protein [Verrucomicrobiae bacterium]